MENYLILLNKVASLHGVRILSIYENKWRMSFKKKYTQKTSFGSYY